MTIVGTVRANSKGFPKEISKGDKENISSSFFYNSSKNFMLINYQCKQKKNVNVLSTMHNSQGTEISSDSSSADFSEFKVFADSCCHELIQKCTGKHFACACQKNFTSISGVGSYWWLTKALIDVTNVTMWWQFAWAVAVFRLKRKGNFFSVKTATTSSPKS